MPPKKKSRCSFTTRKALALLILSTAVEKGMSQQIAMINKNNSSLATKSDPLGNIIEYNRGTQKAVSALEMVYDKCLDKAVGGGFFTKDPTLCYEEFENNKNQLMKIKVDSAMKQLQMATEYQRGVIMANIEKQKMETDAQIAKLEMKENLKNKQQLQQLKNRSRYYQNLFNKFGLAAAREGVVGVATAGGAAVGGAVGGAGREVTRQLFKGASYLETVVILMVLSWVGSLVTNMTPVAFFNMLLSFVIRVIKTTTLTMTEIVVRIWNTSTSLIKRSKGNITQTQLLRANSSSFRTAISNRTYTNTRMQRGNNLINTATSVRR